MKRASTQQRADMKNAKFNVAGHTFYLGFPFSGQRNTHNMGLFTSGLLVMHDLRVR